MIKTVLEEEVEVVKCNLEKCKWLVEILDEDWVSDYLLRIESRFDKHALFWFLMEYDKCRKIERWLRVLSQKMDEDRFDKVFVKELKRRKNVMDFLSLLSEIEVFSYYKSLEDDKVHVVYQPRLSTGKNPMWECFLKME